MKKRMGITAFLLAFSLILSACGSKSANETKGSGTAGESAAANNGGAESKLSGTITVWSWDVALAQLESEAEKFNKLHPDVKFNFEEMGVSQVYSKMTTGLQSGIGLPDVVSLEGEQMAKFGTKFPDKFADFSAMLKKDEFLTFKVAECEVGGKLVAFPWDAGPCGMFYRKDLFEKSNIKAEDIVTWDDFIEAGKKLKAEQDVAMMPLATSRKDTTYRMLMMELGGFYFDKEGKTAVNSPASVEAMGMVKKLYDAGITLNDNSWDDFIAMISASKVACVPEAVWLVGSIKDAAPDQDGKWAVMDMPRFSKDKEAQGASNGGSVLAVPEVSKSKEAAMAFVQFAMTDKEGYVEGFQNYGLYPAFIPALDAEIFKEGDPFFGGQKIYDLFNEIGKKVPACNYTENFAEAIDLSKNAVAKVCLENADPAKVMEDLQKEMLAKFGK